MAVMVNPPPTAARARRARAARPAVAGRSYGGLPSEDRVAGRRARLIEAGIQLFGTQGLRATTVRGVCAQAGLTDRYFYESFSSLEALLQAVYQALMDGLRQRLETQAPALQAAWPAGAAELEQAFTAGYEVWFDAVSDARFARIVLAEVLGVSAEVDALYEAGMRDFTARTTQPLVQARLSAERRALIGRALVGAAVHVARMWVSSGYRASRRSVVRTCVLVAVGTLRALEAELAEG
jgi:AcrR family transcriptional regulator